MIEAGHDAPIHFAGSILGDFRHVCALFSTVDEEYEILLPFLREGLAAGERLVSFVPEDRLDHEDRLRAGGIDVDAARKLHQLEIITSEEAYVRTNGLFDGVAMLQLVPGILTRGREFGFRVTRAVSHLEHVTQQKDDIDTAMEYESRLNYILPKYRDAVICVYDLNKVGAEVVMDVLRTHPMAVLGGKLQENPFFIPPDLFLQDVEERRRHHSH